MYINLFIDQSIYISTYISNLSIKLPTYHIYQSINLVTDEKSKIEVGKLIQEVISKALTLEVVQVKSGKGFFTLK